MRFTASLLSLLTCIVCLSGCGQPSSKSDKDRGKTPAEPVVVELKSVSLPDLEKEIAEKKGKIVVMDLWAVWCGPCKEEFPNLVKMHHKYGKDVACMSLCLTGDFEEKKEREEERPNAVKFLKDKKAVIANYWLEDKNAFDAAQNRWDFKGIPVVVVYGRDGAVAKVFKRDENNNFDYSDVEALVKKML